MQSSNSISLFDKHGLYDWLLYLRHSRTFVLFTVDWSFKYKYIFESYGKDIIGWNTWYAGIIDCVVDVL